MVQHPLRLLEELRLLILFGTIFQVHRQVQVKIIYVEALGTLKLQTTMGVWIQA